MQPGFERFGHVYRLTFSTTRGARSLRLDFHAAKRLLAVPRPDAARMRALRSLLATRGPAGVVSKMTDADVIDHLAARIASRGLHVYTDEVRRESYRGTAPEADDDALAPLSLREVDEPVDDKLDVPAQVAVMKDAARDGVPFCEECEKARLASEAAAPEPFAGTDTAAQAAAMRSAAEDGLPFCEECEKARLELEKQEAAADAEGPPELADTDVPAQAAAMRSAAEDGTPFCEECEKARLAEESRPGA
ncbi:MAG TPA: hypothetical protein VHS09_09555 [Polyangiaceae bacterium]|nr:hypothetical protein [Polyangiaceae bacterium]